MLWRINTEVQRTTYRHAPANVFSPSFVADGAALQGTDLRFSSIGMHLLIRGGCEVAEELLQAR